MKLFAKAIVQCDGFPCRDPKTGRGTRGECEVELTRRLELESIPDYPTVVEMTELPEGWERYLSYGVLSDVRCPVCVAYFAAEKARRG